MSPPINSVLVGQAVAAHPSWRQPLLTAALRRSAVFEPELQVGRITDARAPPIAAINALPEAVGLRATRFVLRGAVFSVAE